jgi:hypothetical protein
MSTRKVEFIALKMEAILSYERSVDIYLNAQRYNRGHTVKLIDFPRHNCVSASKAKYPKAVGPVCEVQLTALSLASSYTAPLPAGPVSAACLAPLGSGTADYKYWNKAPRVHLLRPRLSVKLLRMNCVLQLIQQLQN